MQVLMIRHAPAEEREKFSQTEQVDELRPLSEKGQLKMRKNILGLQTIVPKIHTIVSSPLRRAQQTADLLAQTYSHAHRETLPALAPLGPAIEILNYLKIHGQTTHTIALIGHEPTLGRLVTWLLSGQSKNWMPLKKGGACLLEFPHEVTPEEAQLCWALTPQQLRKLAREE